MLRTCEGSYFCIEKVIFFYWIKIQSRFFSAKSGHHPLLNLSKNVIGTPYKIIFGQDFPNKEVLNITEGKIQITKYKGFSI
jgi:hypothetical protein